MASTEGSIFFNSICDLPSIEKTALSAFCNGNLGELFVEYKENEVLKDLGIEVEPEESLV